MVKLCKENGRGGFRAYRTKKGRKIAIARLREMGWNYFHGYVESSTKAKRHGARWGLDFGKSVWLKPGNCYYLHV